MYIHLCHMMLNKEMKYIKGGFFKCLTLVTFQIRQNITYYMFCVISYNSVMVVRAVYTGIPVNKYPYDVISHERATVLKLCMLCFSLIHSHRSKDQRIFAGKVSSAAPEQNGTELSCVLLYVCWSWWSKKVSIKIGEPWWLQVNYSFHLANFKFAFVLHVYMEFCSLMKLYTS